jgi:hypothetical protein
MYTLKDFVYEEPNLDGLTGPDYVIQHPELLGTVLDGLASLIRSFHITWRESVETICLFGFAQLLLKNTTLSPKVRKSPYFRIVISYRAADKPLARPGRKQATATKL